MRALTVQAVLRHIQEPELGVEKHFKPTPFGGKFPTRVLWHIPDAGFDYLGKPATWVYKAVQKALRVKRGWYACVEFDRTRIVSASSNYLQVGEFDRYRLLKHYYHPGQQEYVATDFMNQAFHVYVNAGHRIYTKHKPELWNAGMRDVIADHAAWMKQAIL